MIYLDIYVPSLEKSFDVEAEEEYTVGEMTGEVIRALFRMTGESGQPDPAGFDLFTKKHERPLPGERKLRECGLESGDRLILV